MEPTTLDLNPSPNTEINDMTIAPYLASKGQRFATYIIDVIVSYIIVFAIGFALISGDADSDGAGLQFLFILLFLVYYVAMEASTGRTIGKYITGTKVIDHDGDTPGVGSIIGRSLSRLVPFEAFSLLFGDNIAWHDSWSKTYVVKNNFTRETFGLDA